MIKDAIEVSSWIRVYREADDCELPLALCAAKSSLGHGSWGAGSSSLIKAIYGSHLGTMTPNLHMFQLNPHVEYEEVPVAFVTEPLEYRMESCYVGSLGTGFCGTNAG